jgi:hypothetical protein
VILHVEITPEAEAKLDAIVEVVAAKSGDRPRRPELVECIIQSLDVDGMAATYMKSKGKRLVAAGAAK